MRHADGHRRFIGSRRGCGGRRFHARNEQFLAQGQRVFVAQVVGLHQVGHADFIVQSNAGQRFPRAHDMRHADGRRRFIGRYGGRRFHAGNEQFLAEGQGVLVRQTVGLHERADADLVEHGEAGQRFARLHDMGEAYRGGRRCGGRRFHARNEERLAGIQLILVGEAVGLDQGQHADLVVQGDTGQRFARLHDMGYPCAGRRRLLRQNERGVVRQLQPLVDRQLVRFPEIVEAGDLQGIHAVRRRDAIQRLARAHGMVQSIFVFRLRQNGGFRDHQALPHGDPIQGHQRVGVFDVRHRNAELRGQGGHDVAFFHDVETGVGLGRRDALFCSGLRRRRGRGDQQFVAGKELIADQLRIQVLDGRDGRAMPDRDIGEGIPGLHDVGKGFGRGLARGRQLGLGRGEGRHVNGIGLQIQGQSVNAIPRATAQQEDHDRSAEKPLPQLEHGNSYS